MSEEIGRLNNQVAQLTSQVNQLLNTIGVLKDQLLNANNELSKEKKKNTELEEKLTAAKDLQSDSSDSSR